MSAPEHPPALTLRVPVEGVTWCVMFVRGQVRRVTRNSLHGASIKPYARGLVLSAIRPAVREAYRNACGLEPLFPSDER